MSEIVVLGHPSLTSKSVNVEKIDDYIVSLTKKMTQIMYEAPGVGLAAPQIGINMFKWLTKASLQMSVVYFFLIIFVIILILAFIL